MGLMDWLCCYEFSIAFGSETDLQSYDRVSQSRKKKSRQMSAKQTVGRQSRIDSWTNSIQEDSLLEDMCQLADIEYDGDATHMTDRAKNKMLKRLSRAPQTENLFKSERALSEFVQRQQLGLPGQKGQSRNTHLGFYQLGIDSRMSSFGSRMTNLGVSQSALGNSQSRISSYNQSVSKFGAPNKFESRLSQNNASRMSYKGMDNRPSHQKLFANPNKSNHNTPSNHNMQSNHNLQKQPVKRESKTYEMATQIIGKGVSSSNKPRKESIGKSGRLSSTLKNILNPNNSIVNERNQQKFGNPQSQPESQNINNLDDLKRARQKSQKPKRTSSKF